MTERIADICIVGSGVMGGILAKELGTAGLKVVVLERGPAITREDYAERDAIEFTTRLDQKDWVRHEPISFRSRAGESSRLRYTTTPLNVLGGALLHWTGQSSRFFPADFEVRSGEIESGLAERAGANLRGYDVTDWPMSYGDLEPYYERWEWEFGVSGKGGANPFEGIRNRDFPLPPLRHNARMDVTADAARRLGYHPYEASAGILSQPYRPPAPYDTRMPERPGCVYCGHCNFYGCHVHAKAATLYTALPVALSTGNVEIRTGSKAFRVDTDDAGRAIGVSHFDPEGAVQQQRARVVILGAFVWDNVRLLLLSGEGAGGARRGLANSSGMVGACVMGHGDVRASGYFEDHLINGFIGPGSAATRIDDFNSNNFDHTGLGFIRGATIGTSGSGTPVERTDVVPPGVPRWGKAYKEFFTKAFNRMYDLNIQSETLPHTENRVDLDPRRRDAWGLPLPRLTFSYHENERRLHRYMASIGEGIMRETGATIVWSALPRGGNRWAGGTRMGADPRTSVVNGSCQSHDVPNLFVMGSSTFPTMSGYPPTATIAALAYRSAEYIAAQREWFR